MPGISAAACEVPTAIAWRQVSRAIRSSLSGDVLAERRRAAAQPLEGEQEHAVEGQEGGGRGSRGEERAQGVLEQQPEDAGRDGADHEQPAQARVDIVGRDLAVAQRAQQARRDPPPVVEEDPEEHDRGRQVGGDQEGQEVVVVLMDVPAEQARQDDRVAQAGDREGLGDALQQAQDDGLQVRDRVHRGEATALS